MSSVNRKPVRKNSADADNRLIYGTGWSLILLTPFNIVIFLLVVLLLHFDSQSYFLLFSYIIGISVSFTIVGSVMLAVRRSHKKSNAESGNVARRESTLCSVCGAIVPYGDASCPVCRSRLLKACTSCGALSAINVKTCSRCGNAV